MSGKVEFDEISESVHRKVTEELCIRMRQGDGIDTESERRWCKNAQTNAGLYR